MRIFIELISGFSDVSEKLTCKLPIYEIYMQEYNNNP